jgi:hypothetical protein
MRYRWRRLHPLNAFRPAAMIISSQDGPGRKTVACLRGKKLPNACSPCTDGSTPKRFGPPDAPPTFGGSLVLTFQDEAGLIETGQHQLLASKDGHRVEKRHDSNPWKGYQ